MRGALRACSLAPLFARQRLINFQANRHFFDCAEAAVVAAGRPRTPPHNNRSIHALAADGFVMQQLALLRLILHCRNAARARLFIPSTLSFGTRRTVRLYTFKIARLRDICNAPLLRCTAKHPRPHGNGWSCQLASLSHRLFIPHRPDAEAARSVMSETKCPECLDLDLSQPCASQPTIAQSFCLGAVA